MTSFEKCLLGISNVKVTREQFSIKPMHSATVFDTTFAVAFGQQVSGQRTQATSSNTARTTLHCTTISGPSILSQCQYSR